MLSLAFLPAAEARLGDRGSMGSRGSNTFSAPPSTSTAPRPAAPIERSITQPSSPQRPSMGGPQQAAPQASPSFGRSLLGGLAGGFLGAGLFGLLSGHGFMGGMGGFMSLLGLLFQAALIVGLIFLVVRMFRRSAPQPAYVDEPVSARAPLEMTPASAGHGPALQPLTITDQDYSAFEHLLKAVQNAYSREDIAALRGLATPEMVSFLGDDLAHNSQRGLVDKVSNVTFIQGDLAEAWHEQGSDYATVAMRFSFINVMVERTTGRVVEGNPNATQEAVEIWTFRRVPGGQWILSAVQRPQ